MLYLGRGTTYPLALEGALKLKEISYIHAEGYAAGELKHGPIALIDENMPVIVIAPYDRVFEKTVSNMQEVAARGGKIILITDPKGAREAHVGVAVDDHAAGHAGHRHAAGLCHPGAAARLSYGGRDGHRRRPAAQPRQIGHRGVISRDFGVYRRVRTRAGNLIAAGSDIGSNRCRMTELDRKPGSGPHAYRSMRRRSSADGRHRLTTALVGRIRNYFLTGLVLVGPLSITICLAWSFVTWVDDLVRPFIPVAYRPETYLPVKVPGIGLIIAFLALTMLGFLTANLVGRTLVEASETFSSACRSCGRSTRA